MRRLLVASAILASLLTTLTLPLAGVAAAPNALPVTAPTDPERAAAALNYLWAAQRPDGSLDKSLGETADFVIGAAAAGYDPSTLVGCPDRTAGASALGYLAGASDAAVSDAAKTGKTILAVVAAGGDPANFAGRDLTARLAALYQSATGAYGDGSTFGQSFAVLAVVATPGGAVPAAALTKLKALQDSDGSWSYGTAPVAAGQGDTNSTAIAVMALDAAGVRTADKDALAYLHTQQLSDGGFPYQNSPVFGPPASDPDSDSIVLQALVAAGQDPEAANWLQGGNSVLTHLRSIQATEGGFAYPGGAPDAFSTSQVPAALVRIPYAGAVHFTAGRSLPAIGCPSPSPTAAPSPSPTPTVKPTPKATPKPTVRPTVRVTVRPTELTPLATTEPTEAITTAPTPTPTPIPTPTPTVAVARLTLAPADSTPGPSDQPAPPVLLYGAAALLGLAVVMGGGWALMIRPRKP